MRLKAIRSQKVKSIMKGKRAIKDSRKGISKARKAIPSAVKDIVKAKIKLFTKDAKKAPVGKKISIREKIAILKKKGLKGDHKKCPKIKLSTVLKGAKCLIGKLEGQIHSVGKLQVKLKTKKVAIKKLK